MEQNSFNKSNELNKYKRDKVCKNCGRRILYSANSDEDLCPMCKEQQLFADVRDYIRANDVRDYEVAEHFNIPLAQVKEWIRQGRIQYKDDPTIQKVLMGNYCEICGTPLKFGTICTACMKNKRRSEKLGVAINQNNASGSSKMQFMEQDEKK